MLLRDDWYKFAAVFTAAGDKDNVLKALEHVNAGASMNLTVAIQLVLAYEELDKPERLDEILKAMKGTSPIVKLAEMFSQALAKNNKEDLDMKAVDALLDQAGAVRDICTYAVGRFLDNREKTKDANPYFSRCAFGKDRRLALLSIIRLRNEGMEPKAAGGKEAK